MNAFGKIKGIAFDLEGTCVDLERFHHEGHLLAAEKAGVVLSLDEAIERIPNFIGGPDSKIAEQICALVPQCKLSPEQVLSLTTDYYKAILYNPLTVIEPRPGVVDFIKYVKSLGLPVSVGSLTNDEDARHILHKSGLEKLFDGDKIVLKSHVKALKPAPDVFLRTAYLMGIDSRYQLVFEDSPGGVEAAKAAGSVVITMPVYYNAVSVEKLASKGSFRSHGSWKDIDPKELLSTVDKLMTF